MKKIACLLFVCSFVFLGCKKEGCTDPLALNYDSSALIDDGSCDLLEIGDYFQGGIIFYLDENGGGLVASLVDESGDFAWGCNGTSINGADGTAIGTGSQNTIDIEADCSQDETAADICANLNSNGYDDWFLPSKDEINLMFNNLIGAFSYETCYWSSSEYDSIRAYGIIINSEVQDSIFSKDSNCKIRPVRAF